MSGLRPCDMLDLKRKLDMSDAAMLEFSDSNDEDPEVVIPSLAIESPAAKRQRLNPYSTYCGDPVTSPISEVNADAAVDDSCSDQDGTVVIQINSDTTDDTLSPEIPKRENINPDSTSENAQRSFTSLDASSTGDRQEVLAVADVETAPTTPINDEGNFMWGDARLGNIESHTCLSPALFPHPDSYISTFNEQDHHLYPVTPREHMSTFHQTLGLLQPMTTSHQAKEHQSKPVFQPLSLVALALQAVRKHYS